MPHKLSPPDKSPLVWLKSAPLITPLSTQMPTPIETSYTPKEITPGPMESTFEPINIKDSRLTDIIAFPSLNSSPETASSVPSAHGEPPTERMTTVCIDFRHHGIWFKKISLRKLQQGLSTLFIMSLELSVQQMWPITLVLHQGIGLECLEMMIWTNISYTSQT